MSVVSLPKKGHTVAVYGSLRQQGYNFQVIKRAGGRYLGSFWTPVNFTMYDLGAYPAVTLNGNNSIYLEVFEVENMEPIDQLEGYPDYYKRTATPTPWGEAWLYYMSRDDIDPTCQMVRSGNWMQHIGGNL